MNDTGEWRLTDRLHAPSGKGDPFAAAVRATRMPMLVTDPRQDDNPIVFANDAFLHLTGYSRGEVMGRNCRFLQGPETDRETVTQLRDAIARRKDIRVDLLNYRKDGTPFWNALYVSPVFDEADKLLFFFASQVDITAHKEAERLVREERDRTERLVQERTRDLQQAFERQEELLHKLDHRVKNNLQMIAALVTIEGKQTNDEGALAALDTVRERVEALGIVHRHLFDRRDIMHFDVSAFIRDLATEGVAKARHQGLNIELDLQPVSVASAHASPVALLASELVRFALRRAGLSAPGVIRIAIKRHRDSHYCLIVEDPRPADGKADPAALARTTEFIRVIARQLGAEVDCSAPAQAGLKVAVELPVEPLTREE
jgi:PAS domain S-box-containing protein